MKQLLKKFGVAAIALVLVGQGCLPGGNNNQSVSEPVELTIWRVLDNEDAFDSIIGAYQQAHPNVRVNYRKLRLEEYEGELVRALAEGRGPDVFSVHNTWVGEYESLISPMPSTVTVIEPVEAKGLQRKVTFEPTEKRMPTLKSVKETFVEQVWRDVSTEDSEILGLPLAMDSLALYYNKDLLDEAGIPSPPQTWDEFQQHVITLTTYDSAGNVERSGAALGLPNNVERSVDILQLLMMQNGTEFLDEQNRFTMASIPENLRDVREEPPALTAAEFYTDFANPVKEVYTWNEDFDGSFEAFVNGQTAYFVGYNYHKPFIEAAAPKLNYAITGIPQISGGREVNFASYWVETVASASKNQNYAWDFVNFAATPTQAATYLQATGKPTAHRSLIATQVEDEDVGVFASQNLTARHWYNGSDVGVMEDALKTLMTIMLQNPEDPSQALNNAARQISQTLKD